MMGEIVFEEIQLNNGDFDDMCGWEEFEISFEEMQSIGIVRDDKSVWGGLGKALSRFGRRLTN